MARSIPVDIGGVTFPRKGDALDYLKSMLNSYSPEERVKEEDGSFLLQALKNHPDSIHKIGNGVEYFFVRRADYGTKCFWIKRSDGSEERFSYKSCV